MTPAERSIRTALLRNAGLRPAIELLLPCLIMETIVISITRHPEAGAGEKEFGNTVIPLLGIASKETLDTLAPHRRPAAEELARNLCRFLLDDWTSHKVAWAISAGTWWLKALLDSGYLVLGEGSAGEQAWREVLDAINVHSDLVAGLERSARKGGRRLQDRLEALGLYRGGRAAA